MSAWSEVIRLLLPSRKGYVAGIGLTIYFSSPAKKTPEELELENEHLRASLDALAVHTQEVESRNKQLREQAEERDKTMRGVVLGVRREVSATVAEGSGGVRS